MAKSFFKVLVIFIVGLVLTSYCKAQTNVLNFSAKGVLLNSNLLTLPCSQNEIIAVFGTPTEIDPAPSDDSATVLEWSNLGVYAYKKAKSDVIYAIGVSINPKFPERKFEKSFSGDIQINQKNLTLTKRIIKSLGFRRTTKYSNWRQYLGSYYITIITEEPNDAREIEFGISSK